jgi:type IV secretory pathway VirB2 component (pilin)
MKILLNNQLTCKFVLCFVLILCCCSSTMKTSRRWTRALILIIVIIVVIGTNTFRIYYLAEMHRLLLGSFSRSFARSLVVVVVVVVATVLSLGRRVEMTVNSLLIWHFVCK